MKVFRFSVQDHPGDQDEEIDVHHLDCGDVRIEKRVRPLGAGLPNEGMLTTSATVVIPSACIPLVASALDVILRAQRTGKQ